MTPAEMTTPGKRMKFLRNAKGLTQETLARQVFVTQPAVAQWEADVCLPARPTQVLVAEALGTTRAFLFEEQAVAS
jgi:transcriptional regulator with XRE-family HTH domain